MPVPRPRPALALVVAALPLLAGDRAPSGPVAPAARGAEAADAAEYRVKAAFLLNFLRYTRWPDDAFDGPHDPLVLEIVGEDPFGPVLEEVFADKVVHGRPIVLRRTEKPPAVITAHAVFATGLGAKSRKQVLDRCAKRPVLLVGEVEGFAADGACINFYIDRSRIAFEINVDSVEEARLSVSSQLLKLARIVESRRGAR